MESDEGNLRQERRREEKAGWGAPGLGREARASFLRGIRASSPGPCRWRGPWGGQRPGLSPPPPPAARSRGSWLDRSAEGEEGRASTVAALGRSTAEQTRVLGLRSHSRTRGREAKWARN